MPVCFLRPRWEACVSPVLVDTMRCKLARVDSTAGSTPSRALEESEPIQFARPCWKSIKNQTVSTAVTRSPQRPMPPIKKAAGPEFKVRYRQPHQFCHCCTRTRFGNLTDAKTEFRELLCREHRLTSCLVQTSEKSVARDLPLKGGASSREGRESRPCFQLLDIQTRPLHHKLFRL